MRICTLILSSLLAGFLAYLLIHTASAAYANIGKGCTTAYYIDEDCDGYGIGPGLLGPDADDSDITVNTLATVEAKYGSMTAGNYIANIKSYFCIVKGYCNIRDIYFISISGSNTAGMKNDITRPFASYINGITNVYSFGAGDLVLYRGGKYENSANGQSNWIQTESPLKSGTISAPIVFASFPGELAQIAPISMAASPGCNAYGAESIWIRSDYIVIDTFLAGDRNADYCGFGIDAGKGIKGVQIKNVEVTNRNVALWMMGGGSKSNEDILIEHSVFSRSWGTHNIYIGAISANYPNRNITLNRVIIHSSRTSYDNIQHNGYSVDTPTIENSIIHSSGQSGINLLSKTTGAVIRNNVIFNNNGNGIKLFAYYSSYGFGDITTNNTIEGNTIYVGCNQNLNNAEISPSAVAGINIENSLDSRTMGGQTIRNNIIVTCHSGKEWPAFVGMDPKGLDHFASSTVENNLIYSLSGAYASDVLQTCSSSANYAAQCPGNIHYYTLAQLNDRSIFPNNSGNIVANPIFADASVNYSSNPEKYDFSLLAGSPAIDAGIITAGLANDIKGRSRTGTPDAGAYEYSSTGPCVDSDHDGYNASYCGGQDCNDNNMQVNPGRPEIAYNNMDDDCNPITRDNDLDNDGYGIPQDCNDANASIHPGAAEICGNGIDEDCSGGDLACPVCYDNDSDTYFGQPGCGTAADCNDNDPSIHANISCTYNGVRCGTFNLCQSTCPNPPSEACGNSVDDDCDGKADCSDSDCFGYSSCPKVNCTSAALIHHYDNNPAYGESSTKAYDFSGNGNNGTCAGASCPIATSGKFSGAFQYDGTSDYLSVPFSSSLELPDSGGGVTAWIYLDPSAAIAQNTYMGIFRKAIHANWAAPGGYGIGLYEAGPSDPYVLRALVGGWNSVDDIKGTTGVTNGQWHHVALTWDTSTLSIYLDGSLEKSSARTKTLSYAIHTEPLRIGWPEGATSTGSVYFKGMVDELALWNHSLSSQDIQLIYDSGPVSCSSQYNRADSNQDGCVDSPELFAFISRWKLNNQDVTLKELMDAIGKWKSGTGC